jgi:hypothetical protein
MRSEYEEEEDDNGEEDYRRIFLPVVTGEASPTHV